MYGKVMLGIVLLFGVSTFCGTAYGADETSLRALAEARGFLIGAAVSEKDLREDPAYGAFLAREYNFLTSESRMKMGPIQPERGRFDWTNADTLVDFCGKHGMTAHGHALVWHHQRPDWLMGDASFSAVEMCAVLANHIVTYVRRYEGRIAVWDVVNEAFEPAEEDGWRRGTPWFDALGPTYFELVYRLAHETDPDAVLVYNDYGIEEENAKADLVCRILKEHLDRGVPIHALGFQFHLSIDQVLKPGFTESAARNMQRFADLGLTLYITELDLPIVGEKTPEAYARQAEAYGKVMELALAQPACKGLQVWGVSDRSSWLDWAMEPKNTPKDPLPFDRDFNPKPAAEALRDVLRP